MRTPVELTHSKDAACGQPFPACPQLDAATVHAALCHDRLAGAKVDAGAVATAGGEAMEVDEADREVLGPERHAALRGGVFWLDPPSGQPHTASSRPAASAAEHQQHRQLGPSAEQEQQGGSTSGGSHNDGPSTAVAQASEAGKQAEGSFMYGGGGGSVLLFQAGDPCPRAAFLLPRWALLLARIYRCLLSKVSLRTPFAYET